ncbi:MAG: hypothetical protein M9909_09935 [Thermomicrobiales bacterium]|nr:hypothetical protein [Thermomicrobiales bacterium]
MKAVKSLRRCMIGLTLLFSTSFGVAIATQDVLPVEIVPPGDEYAGATAAEWDARFWQWSFSIPVDAHPSFHLDNGLCSIAQFGPVFFLPSVYDVSGSPEYEITCAVPEGTALYLQVSAAMCSTIDPEPYINRNEQDLRDCANTFISDLTDSVVTINGVEVENPLQYWHITPVFALSLGPGNFSGLDPVVALAAAEGYGFIILPPTPGQYIIEVRDIWGGFDDVLPVRWIVNVVPPTINLPGSVPEATPAN